MTEQRTRIVTSANSESWKIKFEPKSLGETVTPAEMAGCFDSVATDQQTARSLGINRIGRSWINFREVATYVAFSETEPDAILEGRSFPSYNLTPQSVPYIPNPWRSLPRTNECE